MESKILKWLLRTGLAIALLLALISTAVSFALPGYIEKKLIPGLAREFNLMPTEVHVRRIGWRGADIGPIRFSANKIPVITIAAIQIDYSPLTLIRGEIDSLTLTGVGLELAVTSQGIAIPGLKPPSKATSSGGNAAGLKLNTLLPIKLEQIYIVQSRLAIDWNNRRQAIPFDIELQTGQLDAGRLKGRMRLSVAGNPLNLEALIDQSTQRAELSFDAGNILLESLSQRGIVPARLRTAGTVDLKGSGAFGLDPFHLTALDLSGEFRDTRITTPGLTLYNLDADLPHPQPIVLTVKGKGTTHIEWSCAPFQIDSLLNVTVKSFKGDGAYDDGRWSLNSSVETLIPKQKIQQEADIEEALTMAWKATARQSASENGIELALRGQGAGPLLAAVGEQKLAGGLPEIELNGRIQDDVFSAKGKISSKNYRIELPDGEIKIPEFILESTLYLHPSKSESPSSMTARGQFTGVRSTFGSAGIRVNNMVLEASGKKILNAPWQFDGRFKLIDGRIIDHSSAVRMTNLTIDLPLRWPDAATSEPGQVNIDAIQWRKRQLGGLKGRLQQLPHGVSMALGHTSKLFPGMRVLINGEIDTSGAQIDARIPTHHLAKEVDIGIFAPAAAGMLVSGRIEAVGKLTIGSKGVLGSGTLDFNQGQLHQETQQLHLENIEMQVQLEDIFQMESAPQQKLTVGRLAFGNLKANQLDVDFQIEDEKTLFVEKVGINWSRGKINISPIRITPEKEDYDITLFCDRLNLAMVLEQLGAAKANGEGTVSGRIPVRWIKGHLIFDNGFLFSTPGQTGSIQLSGTESLLAGLPPGTPQHTQLDIATEALKDYNYNWAKLNVQSEEDMLLLKLQFDGKPNKLLPFAYDQSLGQFKRVAGKGAADFTGISIDLNFRSPLNDIMNYKELLKQQ
ncbi:MAG: YdbH domain-containing protein [Desulfobacteraceae bacterium]